MFEKLSKTKINTDFFIDVFAVISVLLIGADIWGVNVGVNLRVDQIFLAILSVLLFLKNQYMLSKNFFLWAFVFFSLISTLFAFNPFRAVLFYFSIIYNTFFVYLCFYNYVKIYGFKKMIKVFRLSCYILFVIMMIQVALKVFFDYSFPFLPDYGLNMGLYRFSIWFYEPSYLATYLCFWLTLALIMFLKGKDKCYFLDVILCVTMLIFSTSTSGFAGLALSFVVAYIVWISSGISLKKILVLLVPLVGILVLYIVMPTMVTFYIGRLFSGDMNSATGGRIEKWAETFAVFVENPVFGVGPGNYGLYLGQDAGVVPSNVTLELMATVGIFGTVCFYGLTVLLTINSFKVYKKFKSKTTLLLLSAALGLFVFTVILQVNQGYLRLYHWMFFGMIDGGNNSILKAGKFCKGKTLGGMNLCVPQE